MIKMKWKKMKKILDDFSITPEALIHFETKDDFEYENYYYKIL